MAKCSSSECSRVRSENLVIFGLSAINAVLTYMATAIKVESLKKLSKGIDMKFLAMGSRNQSTSSLAKHPKRLDMPMPT